MNYNSLRNNLHNNQENWQIDNQELCVFLPLEEDSRKEPYLVNIRKTMPNIPIDLPKDHIVVTLNKNIYVNDTECKPAVADQIFEQNYRSLYREANRFFDHKWLSHGAILKLAPWNGDYDEMLVSTKLDPSYCHNCAMEHPTMMVTIPSIGTVPVQHYFHTRG